MARRRVVGWLVSVRVGRMITRGELVKAVLDDGQQACWCVLGVGVPRWLWGRSGSGERWCLSSRVGLCLPAWAGLVARAVLAGAFPWGTFGNGTVWRGEITGGSTRGFALHQRRLNKIGKRRVTVLAFRPTGRSSLNVRAV